MSILDAPILLLTILLCLTLSIGLAIYIFQ